MRRPFEHGRVGRAAIACLGLLGWSMAVIAQAPAPPASTLSLSDDERADLLDHNSEQDVDAARAGLGSGKPSRQIHGEFGAAVGSHGGRSVYGAAAIPLGDNAGATVSFESSHYGGHR